jgi:hypothetical protein
MRCLFYHCNEPIFLVKVFRLFRLEWIVLGVQSEDTVGRCTTSYLLTGPVCLWCLVYSNFYSPITIFRPEDVVMSLCGSSQTLKRNLPISLKVKKWNYDVTKQFQDKWIIKLLWVELYIRKDGSLCIVKCRIYVEVEGMNKLLACKWDLFFCKHASCEKDNKNIGLYMKRKNPYYSKVCKHVKILKNIYFS